VTVARAVTVVGDALLDRDLDGAVERVAPDAPVPVVDHVEASVRAGGAALAATLARRAGARVHLVTAIGRDAAGAELGRLLAAAEVEVHDLGRAGPTPEKTRVRANGHALVRIDRGGRSAVGPVGREARAALLGADAVLLADYGAGVADAARHALAATSRPVVWDPHPRGPAPLAGATVATPSLAEACRFAGRDAPQTRDLGAAADVGRALRARWRTGAVAVTMGALGAVLVDGSALPFVAPSRRVERGDPCGAGDCFAAHLAFSLACGALPSEAVVAAVAAAGDYVAARPDAAGDAPEPPARARIVATSGCFDLLHAGHVHMLEAARRLGDRLVVLLNSDASVRRLKGARRPLVPQGDRAALLRALACVDDVIVFDDDTPVHALERLRPDVFVKGGDYGGQDIPESRVLAAWGGRAVVVPYLEGRSSSAIAEEAMNVRPDR
jgi:rfaE bifunctional protein nucleotidyltransferase chain/domain/rfaE bifunctional protein kinase chain/domain